jgi:hypothetical protein
MQTPKRWALPKADVRAFFDDLFPFFFFRSGVIDAGRVFFCGFDSGGMFAYPLACAFGGSLFAAICSYNGGMGFCLVVAFLSVHLRSLSLYLSLSLSLSVCLSVFLSVFVRICLSSCLSVCLCVCAWLFVYFCLFLAQGIDLSSCLPVCLRVFFLSICLFLAQGLLEQALMIQRCATGRVTPCWRARPTALLCRYPHTLQSNTHTH